MKADLLAARDEYAFGEITNPNNGANGNLHRRRARVGFDLTRNITMGNPEH